ncbi:MAG: CDP-alcohol phosphatidyltransferase family protein [Micromonosporaceae bacterium]|nr:CDP-alcohol phosphatidyltransferase family protein [Micromonosporaceae bacterium]
MATVRRGPLTGLILQVALLAALGIRVDLGAAGWLAGTGYGLTVCVLLGHGLRRAGRVRLGPADWVTLARAILTGGVTALVAQSFVRPVPVAPMVALAAVALVLDGVDGQVARRTGTCSTLGARFDMEVDAFLILVLSVYDVPRFGAWVLAIGAMRYAFVAAAWPLPWMRGGLPPRYWRKVVAATQGVVLAAAASDLLPRLAATVAIVAALAMLAESFGRDVAWLWRHRLPVPAPEFNPALELVRPAGIGSEPSLPRA